MITQGTPSSALATNKLGNILVTITWFERSGTIVELAVCMRLLVYDTLGTSSFHGKADEDSIKPNP